MSGDWPSLLSAAESEVTRILRQLPPDLRAAAERLPVSFERHPSDELQADGIESDTLGLFVGIAHPESESGAVAIPPQIILFLENIWDESGEDDLVFRDEVRTTFLHELGHYLGLDEIDLEDRGLE